MASITKRTKLNGSTVYKADIRIKQKGAIVHRESKTFSALKDAKRWATLRENELHSLDGLKRAKANGVTVAKIINWYVKEYQDTQEFGRSKLRHLKQLAKFDLGEVALIDLTPAILIDHIKSRRNGMIDSITKEQCKPVTAATANNDLIWIRVAFKTARPHFPDYPINLQVIDDAAEHCRANRLISKPKARDRRPTDNEMEILTNYFSSRDKRASIPMVDIIWFAVHSSRREGEICNLLWSDNHDNDQTGLVRDAKHPTSKEGNHRTFKYTRQAWDIMERQPKTDKRIFPYNAKSVSAAFTRACHACGIEDLRFHDLRHEGVSRLFEAGYSIVEVQLFSLHESWSSLKRYTNLKPKNVTMRD